MSRSFEIIDSPPQPALAVREVVAVTDLPERIGRGFDAVIQQLGRLGEAPSGMPFVGYLSMGPGEFDTVIGFPTSRELSGADDVVPVTIPGGRRAVTMHVGPYDKLGDTYNELLAWVAALGEQPGPAYEHYLNSPDEVPPDELLTRIELLLA